jgi:hypothetical protein
MFLFILPYFCWQRSMAWRCGGWAMGSRPGRELLLSEISRDAVVLGGGEREIAGAGLGSSRRR